MKVLHMISGGDTGGAKTHVFALLDKLKDMADVKIVCFMKGVFWDELQAIDVESKLLLQKSRFDMSVLKTLEEICKEGVDVIHCHGARANFIAAALKHRVKIPMITTIHSDYLLDFDGFYRKLVYTTLNVAALKTFKSFIAVSSSFRDMLISRGFRPNAIYTVYNGMDYSGEPTYVSKQEFAERIGISYDPDITYVGLIGRHDFVKGHDVFIRAIKKVVEHFPNTRFIIAGEGENRENLVSLAKSEGVEDKLIFAGFVKDIYSFIHFIDINTLTSRSESFPYVLMEGARMSKPTVCSAVGGIPDFVVDGKTGLLFPSENSDALAEALIRLLSDPARAEKFGKALHTRAVENFSDTALARKHIEIYNAVLRDYHEAKRYDVTLSGYYGFRNSGDDALLFAICESLRKEIGDVRVCVLSAKAKQMKSHYGIDCVPRFHPFAVWNALKNSKLLLSGGGSLIQDATSSKSLLYYLSIMNLAKKAGCGVYVYANGIGPLKKKNYRRAAKTLSKADYITLRDPASKDVLQTLGVSLDRVALTADPALLLSGASEDTVKNLLKDFCIPSDKDYLGISVRNWQTSDPAFVEKIAEICDYAAEKYSLVPLFLPMRFPHDVHISEQIAAKVKNGAYVLNKKLGVCEMIGITGCTKAVLGMRLHTLIYAAGAAVPVIGIVYDSKISGFLDYIGQHRTLEAANIDLDKAKTYLDEVMKNHDAIRLSLMEHKERLAALAAKNAKIAAELIAQNIPKS